MFPNSFPHRIYRDPPPKTFRGLTEWPRSLTTVVALRGNGFVVMASDILGTTDLTKEAVDKILPVVRKRQLVGFSGKSNYIAVFRRHIVNSFLDEKGEWGVEARLNRAIDDYSTYAANRFDRVQPKRLSWQVMRDFYPQAIFTNYDTTKKQFRIFQIQTPEPCDEISRFQSFAAVGTGGDSATVILATLENIMATWGMGDRPLSWNYFSWKTIARLLHILLRRIAELDKNTEGFDMHLLTPDTEYESRVSRDEYFTKGSQHELGELIEGLVDDIGKERVLTAIGESHLEGALKKLGLG